MQWSLRRQRTFLFGVLVAVSLGGLSLNRFWYRELSHVTGNAEWIWVTDTLEKVYPTGGLFVATFDLETPPRSALLKICGDRSWVAYVNGTAAACGWSRPGFRLDMFDVGHLLRQGSNVLAVEVRSPTPAGGLLLSLDVAGVGQNILVSGPRFVSRGRFSLAAHDPSDGPVPVLWGRPPRFPWEYPVLTSHPRTLDEVMVEDPIRVASSAARRLPGGGLAFELPRLVDGYLWLRYAGNGPSYLAVSSEQVADVNRLRRIAQPVVRIAGQRWWLASAPREIRTVYAFGEQVPSAVEVWPIPPDLSSSAPGVVIGRHGPVQRTRWTTRNPPE